jgi:hypothetical protein
MKTRIVSLALIALAGCGSAKPEAIEDFSDLSALDEKSDAFSYRMRVLGTLAFGSTSQPVKYTSSPRFRAFKVVAKKGDSLDVWVRSTDGDAVTWLTDYKFNVIASNDDADQTTFDSHLTASVTKAGTYYIIFREYGLDKATFSVELGALGCDYNGNHYDVGDSFPSADLCNTCNCSSNGSVGCTKRACLGCFYDGARYNEGDRFPATDGCNTCTCGANGAVGCTEIACASDCRTDGCSSGRYCTVCRTRNGPAYICLPNGAVC